MPIDWLLCSYYLSIVSLQCEPYTGSDLTRDDMRAVVLWSKRHMPCALRERRVPGPGNCVVIVSLYQRSMCCTVEHRAYLWCPCEKWESILWKASNVDFDTWGVFYSNSTTLYLLAEHLDCELIGVISMWLVNIQLPTENAYEIRSEFQSKRGCSNKWKIGDLDVTVSPWRWSRVDQSNSTMKE